MSTRIIQTKLFIPPPSPDHIARQQLLDRLNAGLGAKLTLVTAPLGFGKTSLISSWINQSGVPAGWLSLDQRDNDPAQFFSHFIAALQVLQPSLGAQALVELFASQNFSVDTLLIDLINEMASLPRRYLLVLDDYHLIENHAIHLGITFLLEHLPPQLHLVIATRSDPPLPLAKLRLGGKISELRVDDLRFCLDEVNAYLQGAIGNAISQGDIAALDTRTEGWIAGLQLAVLSMKRHSEQSSFIQDFTGSNRYMIDYLVEEVLNQQPIYLRQFLLQTSVLDRFCGDLCDAILTLDPQEANPAETNGSSAGNILPGKSQEILEQLERSNLFLIPLDNQRRWFRYHHLFADILRHLLSTQQGNLIPILHQRASTWFAANGLLDEAIEHAFAARDWRLASQHISNNSRSLFLHGELNRLVGWVNRLPVEYRRDDLELSIYSAWALLFSGKIEEAENPILLIENQETASQEPFLFLNKMVLDSYLALYHGKHREALQIANEVIQQLNPEDSRPDAQLLYALGSLALADSYRFLGQLDLAEKAYRAAIPSNQKVGNLLGVLVCYRNLGDILFERAQLQRVIDVYQEGIERSRLWAEREFGAAYDLLPTAPLYMRLGEVYYEQDDLEQAAGMVGKGVQLMELSGSLLRINAYHQQARIALARSDLFAVHEQMQKLRRVTVGGSFPYITAQSGWLLNDLRIHLAGLSLPPDYPVGEAALQNEIEDWVQSVEAYDSDQIPAHYEFQSVVLARSFLFLGLPEKAAVLLTRLVEAARLNGRQRRILERLILLARAHLALGDEAAALRAISEALTMGESYGFVRTILDEGRGLRPLLQTALQRNISPRYTTRLLSMLSDPDPSSETLASANRFLVEPLSERELEVLSLVATGLSNQQIADQLFITLSTVKKHTSAIFGKLNVVSRTEAIQLARTLGLI